MSDNTELPPKSTLTGDTPTGADASNGGDDHNTTKAPDSRTIPYNPENREQWLASTYLGGENMTNLTVRDYLKTKEASHPSDSFWQDPHIDWMLEFLRRRYKDHEDVLVANAIDGSQLYAAAMVPGFLDPRETDAFLQTWEPLRAKLDSRDIVIIPVNDGYGIYEAKPEAATEGLAEKDKPQNKKGYVPPAGAGAHWSFIIVDRRDREQPLARYADGMVRAVESRKSPSGWKISGININGRVAGKVMCGFDKLLDLNKGGFDARTLKFVPHMRTNNRYPGDYGSCGPHVYALADHLLRNKERLIHAGLDASFNTNASNLRARARELNFNSYHTRTKLADELKEERRRQEALQPELSVDNLTPELLRSILTIDKLVALVDEPCMQPAPPQHSKKQSKGKGGDNDDDNDGDDDDDNNDGLGDKELRKQYQEARQEGSLPEDITNFEDYQMHIAMMNSLDKSKNASESRIEDKIKDGIHSMNWVKRYPQGFSEANLPDFALLSRAEAQPWRELYDETLFGVIGSQELSYLMYRTVMHATYKGSFSTELLKSLQEHRGDRHAFDADESGRMKTKKLIVPRLDHVYCNLEIPFFAALTEDEVVEWVRNIHPDCQKMVRDTTDPKIPLIKAPILHNKARGLLYRMFVGSFNDMSAQDIAAWAKADPNIPERYKEDNEATLIRMNILYHGEGTETVRYLRRSPLHWPNRIWRAEQAAKPGEKRKRDPDSSSPDDNSGGGGTRTRSKTAEVALVRKPSLVIKLPVAAPTELFGASEPTDAPRSTEDLENINWAGITDVDLEKYLTPAIRKDPRVGPKANKYTYRAILCLQHGGTFKDDSQMAHSSLWVRDTNVFTHGLEEKLEVDLALMENGHFDIRPMKEDVMRRMAESYEPEQSQ